MALRNFQIQHRLGLACL